jgi:hypothetical protein
MVIGSEARWQASRPRRAQPRFAGAAPLGVTLAMAAGAMATGAAWIRAGRRAPPYRGVNGRSRASS